MIISKVVGGLGNQMFQYALGRNLAIEKKASLYIDSSSLKNDPNSHASREFLSLFSLPLQKAPIRFVRKLRLGAFLYVPKPLRKFFRAYKRPDTYIIEPHFHYFEEISSIGNSAYLAGDWQSSKYQATIKKDFTFPTLIEHHNLDFAKQIQNFADSVSVHIRRGDYISNSQANAFHGTSSMDYYEKAIQHIEDTVSNPHYFFFSDDLEWVKQNFKLPNMTLMYGNTGDNSYRDMQLMTLCKHHVIANSSFSWWGAWLSEQNGIVIAPKVWFLDTNINTKDIYEEDWIKL